MKIKHITLLSSLEDKATVTITGKVLKRKNSSFQQLQLKLQSSFQHSASFFSFSIIITSIW